MKAVRRLNTVIKQVAPEDQLEAHETDYVLDQIAEGILSQEQKDFYERNGYLVIRGLVSEENIERYTHRLEEIASGAVKAAPSMLVMRDVSQASASRTLKTITKLQDFQDDPELFSFCQLPEVLNYVKCFVGRDIKAMHTMLIQKNPDVGESGRHPYHQDFLYFPFGPANRIVCAWTAMEHIDRENGCLIVFPGSHASPGTLLPHTYPKDWKMVNKAYYGIQKSHLPTNLGPGVHLLMEKGDTVFFHPLLIHGSGWNKTKGFRKAISCHFAGSKLCHFMSEDELAADSNRSEVIAEVESMAKRKYNLTIPFVDVWRIKSRMVSGGSDDKLS